MTDISSQRLLFWGRGVRYRTRCQQHAPHPNPGATTNVSRLCQMSRGGTLILTEKHGFKSHLLCTKYFIIMFFKSFYLEVILDFKLREQHKESHILFT